MKNNLFYKIFLLLLIAISPFQIDAQDLKEDLLKLQDAYVRMESYHGQIISKAFRSNDSKQPFNTQKTIIWKKGKKSLCKMGDIQVLLNDDYFITVDKKMDVLVCNYNTLGTAGVPQVDPKEVALLLAKADEVIYKGITNGSKCYVLKIKEAITPIIELYLDTESYLPTREVRHFQEDSGLGLARSVIEYKHLDLNPKINNQYFSERQFVLVNKQQEVSPNLKYRTYQLILGEGLSYAAK